ncbi:uncharacterized protein FOMMEDRAFT_123699 [Fomitiporia mediterranea MF3/22]|uniref:uncharacterized protein n=1 Tax=Fomitiporia mediterranea (strain MF3/22) TaxID=694068 RepID=UPI0004408E9A|nr:uncharacterized protein FOMMEDRAFT_123699 [Fomitiporia mediterranea MF3/22]EJD03406.1 hypothetical protein FOMMEDRAFT_123699 [Fomitiporia mediterranea MF3/22]
MEANAFAAESLSDSSQRYHDLALEHWRCYEQSGKQVELDTSIAHDRSTLELRPDGHPCRFGSLCNLAMSLRTRYRLSSQMEDIEESIELDRSALKLCPKFHPNHSSSLRSLATSLCTRYEQLGWAKDVEEAIDLNRAALVSCPEGCPDRSKSIANLAICLNLRYERQGRAEDLAEAIELDRAALELRPEGHQEHFLSMNTLANSLHTRFSRQGRIKDLEEAIELHQAAVQLCPKGHPIYSMTLNDLASSLRSRYELHGRDDDLGQAVDLDRAALLLCPEGNPNRSPSLRNLATSLRTRYQSYGKTDDLEEAIELHRAALDLRPAGHPDRSTSLADLAICIGIRYQQLGRNEDLETAIELERASLKLRPEGHPHRSSSLSNLATCTHARYISYGSTEDLEEAIKLQRAALALLHIGHPLRSTLLDNLANYLSGRYEQHGRIGDLEEAIQLHRSAMMLRPEHHCDRASTLSNLASSLIIRYERQGRAEDLEEAIELDRAALELRPEGHPDHSMSLNNLASALYTRYRQHGRTEDLEDAIQFYRTGVELRPEGHPNRSSSLQNLANSLYARIEKQWNSKDFEECMLSLELAATHSFSGLLPRLSAACRWAELARLHDHDTIPAAYNATVPILHRALTMSPTLYTQHDFLLQNKFYRTYILEAASYAVEKNRLEQAIEMLEQGRGFLWSQLRSFRTPLDQLAETNQELADGFIDVSRRLENLTTSREELMSSLTMDGTGSLGRVVQSEHKSFDELLKLKRLISSEQEEIISDIRRVPGFESFLDATPFEKLQRVASDGPVIVVNHCKYRSDALIVLSRDDLSVACVPLDNLFYRDSTMLCQELVETRRRFSAGSQEYNKKLEEAMKMVWDRVVSKVVDKLTQVGVAKGSRIWWCPTSVLSVLPFHAAGPFEDVDGTMKYLLDDYVSSYTPSLGALINARANGGINEPKLLVIGDTATLHSTRQEIRNIRNYMSSYETSPIILLDHRASRRTVMKMLKTVTWVHFACHGHLGTKPFDSSFKLVDRGLTLLDIIQANVPNAEFAFLSACHTAELSHSGAHDEALHLSAAMQFSGFRSVIGTMWELYDEDGPLFARVVYGYMNECEDGEARYKRAATGLRKAALELRAQDGVPTERWVNFVHIGA